MTHEALTCAIVVVLSCARAAVSAAPRSTSPSHTDVASSANAFAADLWARVAARPRILFLSPLSIHAALGMTFVGAAGDTATQMARVLHVPASRAELDLAYHGVLADDAWHE